jgi:hypothetical protein
MALNTYSGITAALATQTHYDDLTAVIDDLFRLGEFRIFRRLRLRAMETDINITISATATLPADFVELKYAYTLLNNEAMDLEVRPAEAIVREYKNRASEARPRFIGIQQSSFIFGPVPDRDYTLRGTYYRRMTALASLTASTNWFTENAADLLMAAGKVEIYGYKEDFEKAAMWERQFELLATKVQQEENRHQKSRTPVATKPDMRYR